MAYRVIGADVERWDAVAKVKGKADYTADIPVKNLLCGRIVRATIAHGFVREIDFSEALKVPGVLKVLTPDDVPDVKYATAGHPYALNPKSRDIEDRNILTRKVRQYGDDVAAIIAENPLAAEEAAEKIRIVYDELPFYLTAQESTAEGAVLVHEVERNTFASTVAKEGDVATGFEESDIIIEDEFNTQVVQHCHIENQVAVAYQDADSRWVCITSTQIPHICRRIVAQALDIPWGQVRIIKPFIGGGFGNKQDVTIEPLTVAMSMAVGGRPVKIQLSREESMACTRTRHAHNYKMKLGLSKDGTIRSLQSACLSDSGAYASHGHAVAAKGSAFLYAMYKLPHFEFAARTAYSNRTCAGAMRGYGIPQVIFAVESLMDHAARKLGMDPIEFRLKNMAPDGVLNPIYNTYIYTNKLAEVLTIGRDAFRWEEKKKAAREHNAVSRLKRGVGVAAFSYSTGVYPKSLEIAGCRLVLNQDGSIKLMTGAAEIGQGSDTVLQQMVAETVGVPYDMVYRDSNTDTDIDPFDTGAYASRQTYVTGLAVRRAAEELRGKILDANKKFNDIDARMCDIVDGVVVHKHDGSAIETLGELAMKTYYDIEDGECLTVDISNNCHFNSFSTGATFAEVEVDTATGKAEVLSVMNVHDSGVILNPLLASGQVDGGIMMGQGYAFLEELKFDPRTGAPVNNNLLDYKFPTSMDIGDMQCEFVEYSDPAGPYGNKSLGEPPTCSPAPAFRNAILDAIDVEINDLPLSPQNIFMACRRAGLV